MWLLKDGDKELATFPTKRQCVVEAYERGLVLYGRGREALADGVMIEEKPDGKNHDRS